MTWAETGSAEDGGPVVQTRQTEFACYNCHGWRESVPERRPLGKPHDVIHLDHGNNALWCLDCHNIKDMDTLLGPDGQGLAFDQSQRQCQRCHGRQVRDWSNGAHGKRVESWQGRRTVLGCPVCHDPHAPAWLPSQPAPPPPVMRAERARTPVRRGGGGS